MLVHGRRIVDHGRDVAVLEGVSAGGELRRVPHIVLVTERDQLAPSSSCGGHEVLREPESLRVPPGTYLEVSTFGSSYCYLERPIVRCVVCAEEFAWAQGLGDDAVDL